VIYFHNFDVSYHHVFLIVPPLEKHGGIVVKKQTI